MRSLPTYRDTIKSELALRRVRNRGYSLRAFARDLELSPSQLSEILNGKRGLMPQKAASLAQRLMLSEQEQTRFELSVHALHHRSQEQRKRAQRQLRSHFSKTTLDTEKFKIISDWYHFTILELARIVPLANDPAMISRMLDLPVATCAEALQRLFDLKLLKLENGILKDQQNDIWVGQEIPSDAIRSHHRQLMAKAEASLDKVAIEEREFQSLIFSISHEDIPEFKNMVRKFAAEINDRAERRKSRNAVYSLGIQLVPLIKNKKGVRK